MTQPRLVRFAIAALAVALVTVALLPLSPAGAQIVKHKLTEVTGGEASAVTDDDILWMVSGSVDYYVKTSKLRALRGSTTLPATCTERDVYQDTDSTGSETYVCTATNTWTKLMGATDNIATATALAANGANCSSQVAVGVDASGVAECVSSAAALDYIGSTRGSILYRGSSAWSALTPGTSGYLLKSNGSGADPSYVIAPPYHGAIVTNAGSESTTSGAWLVRSFDSETQDPDGLHSTSSNKSRIVIGTTGNYDVVCGYSFASNTTGRRCGSLEKNSNGTEGSGTVIGEKCGATIAVAATFRDQAISAPGYPLSSGDVIECFVFQDSGSALNVSGGFFAARLSAN